MSDELLGKILTDPSVIPDPYPLMRELRETAPVFHSASGNLWIDWVDAEDAVAWTRLNEQGLWESVEHKPYSSAEELWFGVRGGIRLQVIRGP